MPFAKVNDINMYYEIHGEGEPLVVINGGGADSKTQERSIPVFSPEFQMVIFDVRGAGQTDKPDIPYTLEMMADDVAGLLGVLGIDSAHIRGISMGGMIAQHFVIRHPEKVRSLILTSTGCGGQVTPMNTAEMDGVWNLLLQDKITSSDLMKKALELAFTEKFHENNPDFLKGPIPMIDNPLPLYVWKHYIQAQINHDTYYRLAEIKVPTLVIHGEQDRVLTVENAKLMASAIPESEVVIFEKTGHMLTEAGNKATEKILEFLRRQRNK